MTKITRETDLSQSWALSPILIYHWYHLGDLPTITHWKLAMCSLQVPGITIVKKLNKWIQLN